MSKTFACRKCDLQVRWRRLSSGEFCPENLDGSDHWDVCRETTRRGEPVYVSPGIVTPGIGATLYRGRRPPWAFLTWRWVDPADETRKWEWLAVNGYAGRLKGKAA